MRTAISIDDELLARVREFTGIKETAGVVRAALQAYVEREAARRLALMGGSDPTAKLPRRRRP